MKNLQFIVKAVITAAITSGFAIVITVQSWIYAEVVDQGKEMAVLKSQVADLRELRVVTITPAVPTPAVPSPTEKGAIASMRLLNGN